MLWYAKRAAMNKKRKSRTGLEGGDGNNHNGNKKGFLEGVQEGEEEEEGLVHGDDEEEKDQEGGDGNGTGGGGGGGGGGGYNDDEKKKVTLEGDEDEEEKKKVKEEEEDDDEEDYTVNDGKALDGRSIGVVRHPSRYFDPGQHTHVMVQKWCVMMQIMCA